MLRHCFCALAVFLLLASGASAAESGRVQITVARSYLSAVSCTDSEASRTFTLVGPENYPGTSTNSVGSFGGYGWGRAVLMVSHPAHSSATNIAITCFASVDSGSTWGQLPACTPNGTGGCTYYGATSNLAVNASGYLGGTSLSSMPVRVDISGHVSVKCTATCTGAAAGDPVSAYGYLVTD